MKEKKSNKNGKFFSAFKEYFLMAIGITITTVGVYFFKIPNGFATGGVSGVSTILGKLIPVISPGLWIMILNTLLLILGFIFLGKMNGIKTVFCSGLYSVLTYVLELILPLDGSTIAVTANGTLTDQPLMELVYAMLLTAFGSAILFNCGASSGGTDIVALILKKYTNLDEGKALLVSDGLIAASSFIVFGITAGLLSVLGLFMKAFLVDFIIESINACKYFVVITDKGAEINQYIIKELRHSSTFTGAVGGYTNSEKMIIHTVCKRIEAYRLRSYIKKIDPNAFIIITTTSEIIGRGFRSV